MSVDNIIVQIKELLNVISDTFCRLVTNAFVTP